MYGLGWLASFFALNANPTISSLYALPPELASACELMASHPESPIRESVRAHQFSTTPSALPQYCEPPKNSNVKGSMEMSFTNPWFVCSRYRKIVNLVPSVYRLVQFVPRYAMSPVSWTVPHENSGRV